MNAVIYKYPLLLTDVQTILMPLRAKILSVKEQSGSLCLWALVDRDEPRKRALQIAIAGTGNPLPSHIHSAVFIDTVVMQTMPLVWHIFEVSE